MTASAIRVRENAMIRIEMDGMCKSCMYADLELDCVYLDISGQKFWTIKCIHRDACDNMETKTINRLLKRGRSEE